MACVSSLLAAHALPAPHDVHPVLLPEGFRISFSFMACAGLVAIAVAFAMRHGRSAGDRGRCALSLDTLKGVSAQAPFVPVPNPVPDRYARYEGDANFVVSLARGTEHH